MMTISETAKQIYNLSLAGYINGEKFTLKRFEAYARNMLKTADSFIFEICLPDGRWMAKFSRFGKRSDEYDYHIPDTRQQEKQLKDELLERSWNMDLFSYAKLMLTDKSNNDIIQI